MDEKETRRTKKGQNQMIQNSINGKGSQTRKGVDWKKYRTNNENIKWPHRQKLKEEKENKKWQTGKTD